MNQSCSSKLGTASQYRTGWLVAQKNFNRFLKEQNNTKSTSKRILKNRNIRGGITGEKRGAIHSLLHSACH